MRNDAKTTDHPFLVRPHRTLLGLMLPVLLSLVAEPLTGLVDTAFIARLGAAPLAALGVGTMALSSVFWIFNFLGIGTQTELSYALGRRDQSQAARMGNLSFGMGLICGSLLAVLGIFAAAPVARLMGAAADVHRMATDYIQIRLIGAPAVLATIAAFGCLRGLQDMRTPLWVAVGVNALNILLDAVLIFGWGPIPPLGVVGAAAASAASQWLGAVGAGFAIYKRLGLPDRLQMGEAKKLLQVGGELFVRTGLLTLFLLLATRAATRIGPEAGAAHQAIRQFWVFANLSLDAFAVTAQSLVGYFIGSRQVEQARKVAYLACLWSLAAGTLLAFAMLFGRPLAAGLLVPDVALALFMPAWLVAAAAQPISALSFATDGIHWGTGDFRYLRNVVVLATGGGVIAIQLLDLSQPESFTRIWLIVAFWILIRGLLGVLRIWPGIGKGPLGQGIKQKDLSKL
jgi:MATE family multidrug resistance protein